MAILSAMVASLSTYYPETENGRRTRRKHRPPDRQSSHAGDVCLQKVDRSADDLSAKQTLKYCDNFLHMMFAVPCEDFKVESRFMSKALNMLLILHADHEQNCSTSTVRMVGSSRANIFASISAGICASVGAAAWWSQPGRSGNAGDDSGRRWRLRESGFKKAKDKDDGFRLMGFRSPRLQEL